MNHQSTDRGSSDQNISDNESTDQSALANSQDLLQKEFETSEILRIRQEKLAALCAAGNNPYEVTRYDVANHADEIHHNFDTLEGQTSSITGRIMTKRDMGKASFAHIQDRTGQIQIYVRKDQIGDEAYETFKKLDLGDIVGVQGEIFRTKMGEISLKAVAVKLLTKCMLPLPEKWHGLKDTDMRYRQRYLDLIVNPAVRETFVLRSKIIKSIRAYLDGEGYLEVDTPILQTLVSGATARPFMTHHNTLDIEMYLRVAPELSLEKLIVGGMERVYEMGRMFRNEGMSYKHNPEFTMIELYQAYTDYHGMMRLCESLMAAVAQEVLGTTTLNWEGTEIVLAPPFKSITMMESVKQVTGLDFSSLSKEEAHTLAKERHVQVEKHMCAMEVMTLFFEQFVEETLIQPTFITHHPVVISPLAKACIDDPRLTERFELFIAGREMANAFSELNDPEDQRERFQAQVAKREAGDEEASTMDLDFTAALQYGLPPTGGMGIGVDRFIMLLTDSHSIRDVLLFPTMKPRDGHSV